MSLAMKRDIGILSVFVVPLVQDAVFFEANDHRDVKQVCEDLPTAFEPWIRIQKYPIDEAHLLFKNPGMITPAARSWVRMRKPKLYRGDLVFVFSVNARESDIDVILVPRISFQPRKRKMPANAPRPLPARLDVRHVEEVYGHGSTRFEAGVWTFNKDRFLDGFLIKQHCSLDDFFLEEATPTPEEIRVFQLCSIITLLDAAKAFPSTLNSGDQVKVVLGEQKGITRTVESVTGDIVRIACSPGSNNGSIDLPAQNVRKGFRVGDQVQVVAGPHVGFTGWITGTVDFINEDDGWSAPFAHAPHMAHALHYIRTNFGGDQQSTRNLIPPIDEQTPQEVRDFGNKVRDLVDARTTYAGVELFDSLNHKWVCSEDFLDDILTCVHRSRFPSSQSIISIQILL